MTIRGAEGTTKALVASLELLVPPALADLALPVNAGGLGPLAGLENPKLYAPTDRFRLVPTDYPAVLVMPQNVPQAAALDDGDDGNERLAFRYVNRVFVAARARGFDEVAMHRNRLMLALRLALMRNRQLAPGLTIDAPGKGGAVYRESYSSTARAKDARSIASGFIDCSLLSIESASMAPLGVANTVGVDLHLPS